MLLEILGVVAPVFLIAGIGYLLEKGGAGLHHETMSTLVMTAGAPALIFSSLTSTELSNSTWRVCRPGRSVSRSSARV